MDEQFVGPLCVVISGALIALISWYFGGDSQWL